MRQARGDALLLLNSDTVVQTGALDGMLSILEEIPQAGVIGCKLLNQDNSIQESWAEFPTLASEFLGRNFRKRGEVPGWPGLYETDWVGGACILVRKEAVQQVGLLDESFFMYSEEVDWCFRMKARGWNTFFLESAAITHLGGGSASRSGLHQLTRLYESKLRFFRKNYGLWQVGWLRAGLILVNLLGVIWRGLALFIQPGQAGEQRRQIHSQWQLVRWLWSKPPL
jgi:GT2 family glycosyltransferase